MILQNLITLYLILTIVDGHGYLVDPPNRSSAWRYGFKTPINTNDMELSCGGLTIQKRNRGKCGVCGDRWDATRDHELPDGKYTKKLTITRSYRVGQTAEVLVNITSAHRGYFTFKLCPINNLKQEVSQKCLDRHVVRVLNSPTKNGNGNTSKRRYELGSGGNGPYVVRLKLPDGRKCRHCVLQWTYRAGNNWGRCQNGTSGDGCGPQEHYRNCADIRIL